MAYFIELGLDRGEGLYLEIAIVNKNTGLLLDGSGIDHQLLVSREYCDYGQWNSGSQLIASNSNGMITTPELGIVAINIPPLAFCGFMNTGAEFSWYDYQESRSNTLRCKLVAVPADPTFAKTIFTGTISFGDRAMACPRIKLGVYPLYPNSATATSIPIGVQVSQIKQQLASLGAYDQVEAALTGGVTDPATISWTTGGPVSANGPLYNVIAQALGYNTTAMTLFLLAASQRLT